MVLATVTGTYHWENDKNMRGTRGYQYWIWLLSGFYLFSTYLFCLLHLHGFHSSLVHLTLNGSGYGRAPTRALASDGNTPGNGKEDHGRSNFDQEIAATYPGVRGREG